MAAPVTNPKATPPDFLSKFHRSAQLAILEAARRALQDEAILTEMDLSSDAAHEIVESLDGYMNHPGAIDESAKGGPLVKLPNDSYVNPAHVTCIELLKHSSGSATTKVWVKKDSGYGTGSFDFPGDQADKLAKIINGETT